MRNASIDEPDRTSDVQRAAAPFEQLCPLFDSPSGPVQLARIMEGPEYGRIAVLRAIEPQLLDAVLAGVVKARNLSHPSISKFLGILEHDGQAYIASEYVQGVALFELMRASKGQRLRVTPAASVRIIHDALVVAEQLRASRPDLQGERYLFPDTIWVAEYGATLLSEPGLVACFQPGAGVAHAETSSGVSAAPASSRRGLRAGSASDTQAAAVLLLQLLTSNAEARDTRGAPCQPLPNDVMLVIRKASQFSTPGEMAQALAALPADYIGTEAEVAEAVEVLVGELLEARGHAANPPSLAGENLGLEDETACFVGAALMDMRVEKVPPRTAEPSSRFASGERPIQQAANPQAWVAPASLEEEEKDEDEDEDDQEVTIAFRPSSIPRLISRDKQPATEAAAEGPASDAVQDSSNGDTDTPAAEVIGAMEVAVLGEQSVPASSEELAPSIIVADEETLRGQRYRVRRSPRRLAIAVLGVAVLLLIAVLSLV